METNLREKSHNSIVNAFSVDVEGFIEAHRQNFHIPDKYIDQSKEDYEIERNMDVVLEILATTGIKATFFFLGRIAKDIPNIVKKTSDAGHEIGCHNYAHLHIFGVDKDEFKEKISSTKRQLESVSGKRIYGFRAPDFSITKSSIWALDVLRESGFVYDSSIYPFGLHDVYGIKDANPSIHTIPNGLIEFPLSTTVLLGKRIPFGGGGYFRLYPLWITKALFSKLNKKGHPVMFYIHPYEVGPEMPMIYPMSICRRFRHYYNCKKGQTKLPKLLKNFKFAPVIKVLKQYYDQEFE